MKKLKGISLILICLLLIGTVIGCGGKTKTTENKAPKTYIMKISHSTSTNDFMHKGYVWFKDEIEKKTNGQIKVEIYDSSQLTVDRTAMEFIRDNQIQLSSAPTSIIATMTSDNRWFFSEIPFYFGGDVDKVYRVTDSESFTEMAKAVESKLNCKIYGTYSLGMIDIGNSKKPVTKMADFKGLKLRCSETETWMKPLSALGTNPTPMNYGEVYTGLQQGTIDGLATITNLFVTSKFSDFTKYHNELGIFPSIHTLTLSKKFYDSLPADLQKSVDESMVGLRAKLRTDSKAAANEAFKKLEGNGVKVQYLTPEFLKECQDATAPWAAELRAKVGEDLMKKFDDARG